MRVEAGSWGGLRDEEEHHGIAEALLPQNGLMRWGVVAGTVLLALRLGVPPVAHPVTLVLTPRPSLATPASAATPHSAATPIARPTEEPSGIGSRLLGQQSAAQATIAAYDTREAVQVTRIASLEAALADVQVTATALVVVAANTVLDPTRQSITLQTELEGMLSGDPEAVAGARTALTGLLSRYPSPCRAGFMLISGNAPSVEDGVALAQRAESLLREGWPEIVTEATGAELFALPNQPPFGQVSIDIYFYAGCQPTPPSP